MARTKNLGPNRPTPTTPQPQQSHETTNSSSHSSKSHTPVSEEVTSDQNIATNTPKTRSGRKAIKEHKMLIERGFDLKALPTSMKKTMKALKWESFAVHPTEKPNATITQEFYCNLGIQHKKPVDYSVVRKKLINFEAAEINRHLGLTFNGDSFSDALKAADKAEMERVKSRLALPGVKWFTKEGEFKLKRMDLKDEAKFWFFIVNHKLMPSSHTTYIDKTRLVLLDLICQGKKVNVGRIIEAAIKECKLRQGGFLYFPCLITSMALEAGVPVKEEDVTCPLQMAVNEITMGRVKGRKEPPKKAAKKAETSADAVAEEKSDADAVALLQQHISKTEIFWGYARRHNEWMQAVMADNLRLHTEPPQFPEGLLPSYEAQPSKKRKRDPTDEKQKGIMSDSSLSLDDDEENDDSLTSSQQDIAKYYESPPSATDPRESMKKKADGAGPSGTTKEPAAAASVQQPESPQAEENSDAGTEVIPEEEESPMDEDKSDAEVSKDEQAEKEVAAEKKAMEEAEKVAAGAMIAVQSLADLPANPLTAEAAVKVATTRSGVRIKSTYSRQSLRKMNDKAKAHAQLKKDIFGSSSDK